MSYQFSEELDADKLQELYLGDATIACEVFGAFMQENSSIVSTLQTSFSENDTKGFSRLLHKIKPGFLYVGLSKVYSKINATETKCEKVSDLALLRNDVDDIVFMISDTMSIIRTEFEKLKLYTLA